MLHRKAFLFAFLLALGFASAQASADEKKKPGDLLFDKTETLDLLLFQSNIHREIGWDLSAGIRWRPYLNQNVVLVGGVAALLPGKGFVDIYERDSTLFAAFTDLVLSF